MKLHELNALPEAKSEKLPLVVKKVKNLVVELQLPLGSKVVKLHYIEDYQKEASIMLDIVLDMLLLI